jgi:hypothetical protein
MPRVTQDQVKDVARAQQAQQLQVTQAQAAAPARFAEQRAAQDERLRGVEAANPAQRKAVEELVDGQRDLLDRLQKDERRLIEQASEAAGRPGAGREATQAVAAAIDRINALHGAGKGIKRMDDEVRSAAADRNLDARRVDELRLQQDGLAAQLDRAVSAAEKALEAAAPARRDAEAGNAKASRELLDQAREAEQRITEKVQRASERAPSERVTNAADRALQAVESARKEAQALGDRPDAGGAEATQRAERVNRDVAERERELALAVAMDAFERRLSDNADVARLWEQAARGRSDFKSAREAFWNLVNNDRGAEARAVREMMELAGFQTHAGTSRAPTMQIEQYAAQREQDRRRVQADLTLSIDHADAQARGGAKLAAENLRFMTARDNSMRGARFDQQDKEIGARHGEQGKRVFDDMTKAEQREREAFRERVGMEEVLEERARARKEQELEEAARRAS